MQQWCVFGDRFDGVEDGWEWFLFYFYCGGCCFRGFVRWRCDSCHSVVGVVRDACEDCLVFDLVVVVCEVGDVFWC